MRGIAKRLDDTQLILVCGHNFALADQLRETSARAPRAVIGFTSKIRYFMHLSDFFIGKPGPGSISEAIQQRLPVIWCAVAWTMLQERYNTDWVQGTMRRNRTGFVQRHCCRRRRGDEPPRCLSRLGLRAFGIAPYSRYRRLEGILRLSDADSGKHRYHPAFPFRPVPASVPGSICAVAERIETGLPPNAALRVWQYGGELGGLSASKPARGVVEEPLRGGFGAVGAGLCRTRRCSGRLPGCAASASRRSIRSVKQASRPLRKQLRPDHRKEGSWRLAGRWCPRRVPCGCADCARTPARSPPRRSPTARETFVFRRDYCQGQIGRDPLQIDPCWRKA